VYSVLLTRLSLEWCTPRTTYGVPLLYVKPYPGRGRGRGVYVWQSAGCRSRLWSVASARPARAESGPARNGTRMWVCATRRPLAACEWVCSASCDHVYISRQASAAHRTHNNKNTTKHRSFQTATICSSWTCSSKTQTQLHARALARTHGAEQRLRASRALALKSRARATLL